MHAAHKKLVVHEIKKEKEQSKLKFRLQRELRKIKKRLALECNELVTDTAPAAG